MDENERELALEKLEVEHQMHCEREETKRLLISRLSWVLIVLIITGGNLILNFYGRK